MGKLPTQRRVHLSRHADLALVAALGLVACHHGVSEDRDADADADVDADGDVELVIPQPAPPVLPALPELPSLTPCPPGWREVPPEDGAGVSDVTTCDPWPESGAQECAAIDAAHFPGEPGCTRVGSPCPDGEWTAPPDADAIVLYVKVGATAGGDGSVTSPFGTIAEAMAAATPGTVVSLSKGTFDEEVVLAEGVTLWGACVAETLVTCSALTSPGSFDATIVARDEGGTIGNLRVSGSRAGLRAATGGAVVHVEDVVFSDCEGFGIYVTSGAELTGRTVVVRDTSVIQDGTRGLGVLVSGGASIALERAVIERSQATGVGVAEARSTATFSDLAVRDTSTDCRGLDVGLGAHVEARRAVFEQTALSGVGAFNAGTDLTMEDVIVRETRPTGGGDGGFGVHVGDDAHVEGRRVLIERAMSEGLMINDVETTGSFTDLVVRDTRSAERSGRWGRGVEVGYGAHVDITRALVLRNRDDSIIALNPETSLELTDVTVRGTTVPEGDLDGDEINPSGLVIALGATVNGARLLFESNDYNGVLVDGRIEGGAALYATDVTIRETRSLPEYQMYGYGIAMEGGALAELERVMIESTRGVGIWVAHSSARLTLDDAVIRNTLPAEWSRWWGRAMLVSYGGHAEVRRAVFEQNHEMTVGAFNVGTEVRLEDVAILETQQRPCEGDACDEPRFGTGLSVCAGAHVDIARFTIADNALCGVQLAHGATAEGVVYEEGGTLDLHEGVVSGNVFGANVQTVDFDVSRLMDRVIWRDNVRNIDSSQIPLPDLTPPL